MHVCSVHRKRRRLITYSQGCAQTRELWCSLLAPAGLLALAPDHTQSVAVWWLGQRALLERAVLPSFDSLVLLISWII